MLVISEIDATRPPNTVIKVVNKRITMGVIEKDLLMRPTHEDIKE